MGDQAAHAATVRRLAAAVDERVLETIADAMAAEMRAGVPEAMAAPEFAKVVRAANYGTINGFLGSLDGEIWVVPEIPRPLVDLALTLARRGDEVTVLMKLARHGQAVFWPALMREAERAVADPAVRMRVLGTLFEQFGRYMEVSLDGAVSVYQQERDQRMRGARARREETIRALLAGDDIDAGAASKALGVELARTHTALVLWDTTGAQEVLSDFEATAREIAAAFGVPRAVMMASGARGLWAWVTTADPPARPSAVAELVPEGIRVAIGTARRGVQGFLRSHADAVAAQRFADLASGSEPVTWYEDVELMSLLARDPEAMRAFVARELGALAGRRPTDARLRSTALAYLDCGCNTTATARRLGAHKNTVHYRIKQVEDALGRSLATDDAQLRSALALAAVLGDAALPP